MLLLQLQLRTILYLYFLGSIKQYLHHCAGLCRQNSTKTDGAAAELPSQYLILMQQQ
jgi:hypothetical protein